MFYAGDESGMLEDMYIGVMELASVTFQVRTKKLGYYLACCVCTSIPLFENRTFKKKKKYVSARDRTGDLARVRRT